MRNAPNMKLEKFRIIRGVMASSISDGNNGAFVFPGRSVDVTVIASDGGGWEHVSVSCHGRCPTWEEMCAVKEIFWRDDEAVMQLHPAKSEHINNHPFCLHLWKPCDGTSTIPLPPSILVGLKEFNP